MGSAAVFSGGRMKCSTSYFSGRSPIVLLLAFSLIWCLIFTSKNTVNATPFHAPLCSTATTPIMLPARWASDIKKAIANNVTRYGQIAPDWTDANNMKVIFLKDTNAAYTILVADKNFTVKFSGNGVATGGTGSSELVLTFQNTSASSNNYYYIRAYTGSGYGPAEPQANTVNAGATGTFTSGGNNITCVEFAKGVTYDTTTFTNYQEAFNSTLPYASDTTIFGGNYGLCTNYCTTANYLGLTDAQLRASPINTSGGSSGGSSAGLTDAQLRAQPIPITGTITLNKKQVEKGVALGLASAIGWAFISRFKWRGV